MATVRFEKTFPSEAAARDWVATCKVEMWGYDPSFTTWQDGDQWVVSVSHASSCD